MSKKHNQSFAAALRAELAGLPGEGRWNYNEDCQELQTNGGTTTLTKEVDPALGPVVAELPRQLDGALQLIDLLRNAIAATRQPTQTTAEEEEATNYMPQLWRLVGQLHPDTGSTLDAAGELQLLLRHLQRWRWLGQLATRLYHDADDEDAWNKLYEALHDLGLLDDEGAGNTEPA